MLENLAKCLLNADLTEVTASLFPEIVVLLFQEIFSGRDSDGNKYKQKVIALAKLIDSHSMLKRLVFCIFADDFAHLSFFSFAYNHFNTNPLIFWEKSSDDTRPAKQRRISGQPAPPPDSDIVKAAYFLLKSDPNLFKQLWKWSDFLDLYWNKGDDTQKFFCNKIIGILTGAGQARVSQLHAMSNISEETLLYEGNSVETPKINYQPTENVTQDLTLTVPTSDYINVEGVFLPIFDKKMSKCPTDVEMVSSTRTNLRSLALAIASNKPVCLNGPVGCGKSMLVEYLSKVTGRVASFTENEETKSEKEGTKRKRRDSENVQMCQETSINAMLRIQLGDQTDSKTLLGQYR